MYYDTYPPVLLFSYQSYNKRLLFIAFYLFLKIYYNCWISNYSAINTERQNLKKSLEFKAMICMYIYV